VPEAMNTDVPRTLGKGQIPTVNLMSVATEIPAGRVSTAELAEQFGVSEEWIVRRTGIRSRPRATAEERLSDFAARAGQKALDAAGVDAHDLDLVIVATVTADELMPAAAPLVAMALGADRAGAFDVGAACTGFLTGLAVACGQIESGRANRVLLIGADFCSRFIDHDDRKVAPLFADAAGAVVIGSGEPRTPTAASEAGPWVGPIVLRSDGEGGPLLYAERTDPKIKMDGPEVFRHAITRMQEATLEAISAANTRLSEIDLFVYHQANARITRALRERLEVAEDRVVDCIERLGNSTAATLPLALAHAQADGRLRRGSSVLLSAFGAGFTWGACVLHWGGPEVDPLDVLFDHDAAADATPRV
jgi:3-oxoacyl-[acyl-carrier-protein] synthase-3